MTDQKVQFVHLDDLVPWEGNPRVNESAVPRVAASIDRFGFVSPVVVWGSRNRIVAGHTRIKALRAILNTNPGFVAGHTPGVGMVPVRVVEFRNETEANAYALADNRLAEIAAWDDEALTELLTSLSDQEPDLIRAAGWDDDELKALLEREEDPVEAAKKRLHGTPGRLISAFGAPPFTVLDARQGYWRTRKDEWHNLGIVPEAGREHLRCTVNKGGGLTDAYDTARHSGGSTFDPVFAELMYRWFCPAGGSILDPFAGESTKGVVASILGFAYTGIEVRQEQVDKNRAQWTTLEVDLPTDAGSVPTPTWIPGDSNAMDAILPATPAFDLVFTSPPYFNLEGYSTDEKDGSSAPTYEAFMTWYESIFTQAVARLKDDRFLIVKIADVRDLKDGGSYYGFLQDNLAMFRRMGLVLYNEAIIITPVGSMIVRASKQFTTQRKLCRGHQNVLIFYKGPPKHIAAMGPVPEDTIDLEKAESQFAEPPADGEEPAPNTENEDRFHDDLPF